MARQDTPCGRMPLWKWIIFFILGSIIFMILYGLASVTRVLPFGTVINAILTLWAGFMLLAAYYGWIKITEKHRAVNELKVSLSLKETVKGMGIGFLYFCAITALLAISGMYKVQSVSFDFGGLVSAFCMFFVVGVGEELVFRGIIFRMIDERFSTWAALLVSGLLFGFVHIMNPGAGVWSSVAIAIEAGLMLGLAYKWSGTLWMPIGIHWAWNFTQGNVFGFGVSGMEAGASLFNPIVTGPDFLTGGAFGPEASVTAAALGLLISLAFLKTMKKFG